MVNSTSTNKLPLFYKQADYQDNKTIFNDEVEGFLDSSKKIALEILGSHGNLGMSSSEMRAESRATNEFKAKLHVYQMQSPKNVHLLRMKKIVNAQERIFARENSSVWNIALTIGLIASTALILLGALFAHAAAAALIGLGVIGALAVGSIFLFRTAFNKDKHDNQSDAQVIVNMVDDLWHAKKPILQPIHAPLPVLPPVSVDADPVVQPVVVQSVNPIIEPVFIQPHVVPTMPLISPIYVPPPLSTTHFLPIQTPGIHVVHPPVKNPVVVIPPRTHHNLYHAAPPTRHTMPTHVNLREIPGQGRREPIRNAAAALSRIGVSTIHKPSLVASPARNSHMPYHHVAAPSRITHHPVSNQRHSQIPLSQLGRFSSGNRVGVGMRK